MLALDPSETFDVRLSTDAHRPDAERAAFTFRYLSAREFRKVNRLAGDTKVLREVGLEQTLDRLTEAIRVNLVGWRILDRNADEVVWLPFDPANLEDLCTVGELWELFDQSRAISRLDGASKNGSGSPSPSSTVKSVRDAAAATEPETAHPTQNPSNSTAPPAAGPAAISVKEAFSA